MCAVRGRHPPSPKSSYFYVKKAAIDSWHQTPLHQSHVHNKHLEHMYNNKFIVLPCLDHLSVKGKLSGIRHDEKDLKQGGGQHDITHKIILRVKRISCA